MQRYIRNMKNPFSEIIFSNKGMQKYFDAHSENESNDYILK
jgi:hypothetical protein